LAKLLPNSGCITECDSDSDRYSSAAKSGKHVQLSVDGASGESTNQAEDKSSVVNKKLFSNSDISMYAHAR
jgi:hypothetical protein